MQAILTVVVPFFTIIAIGYIAARRDMVSRADVEGITKFVFWFPLPLLLFRGIAARDLAEMADLRLFFAYAATTLILFFVCGRLFRRLFRLDREQTIFHGFGTAQSNNGFLAIPLMPALFGEQAMAPLALTLFADMLVLYSVVFIMADLASSQPQNTGERIRTVARSFYANPILAALLLGLAVAAMRWKPPVPLHALVDTLAQAGPPAALFVLGASLAIHRTKLDQRDEIALISLAKLVIHPALLWVIGSFLIPLTPLHLAVGVAVAALPTGINLFLFSQRYVKNPAVYSAVIMTTTAVSVVSFSAVVWIALH